MYDFVNRFSSSGDENIVTSLDPILGGPGWQERLDGQLPRGLAVEKLFRETLKTTGNFEFVVSTKIDKATAERPHFFITYGTKDRNGLIAFRQIEFDALRAHAKNRVHAKEQKRQEKLNMVDMFADYDAELQEASIEDIVEEQKRSASLYLVALLQQQKSLHFARVVDKLLEAFMLRETNVKDICVALARGGIIERTWGPGNRKPQDADLITLPRRL
jgi:hypothetical protein